MYFFVHLLILQAVFRKSFGARMLMALFPLTTQLQIFLSTACLLTTHFDYTILKIVSDILSDLKKILQINVIMVYIILQIIF